MVSRELRKPLYVRLDKPIQSAIGTMYVGIPQQQRSYAARVAGVAIVNPLESAVGGTTAACRLEVWRP